MDVEGPIGADPQSPPLADGVVLDAPVNPQLFSRQIHNVSRPGGLVGKDDVQIGVRDEVLALTTICGGKPPLPGHLEDLLLGVGRKGEAHLLQGGRRNPAQEVGLVLPSVRGGGYHHGPDSRLNSALSRPSRNRQLLINQPHIIPWANQGSIVAGAEIVKVNPLCPDSIQQRPKLYGAVAVDAGIGGAATPILTREVVQHVTMVGIPHIDDVMLQPLLTTQFLALGYVDSLVRAVAGGAHTLRGGRQRKIPHPAGHGDTDNTAPPFLQQQGRQCRVNTAGHTHRHQGTRLRHRKSFPIHDLNIMVLEIKVKGIYTFFP